jgi:hypothetical protein
MSLEIHNTQDWEPERVLRYGAEITEAFRKMQARFPREVTVKSLAEDAMSGRQVLWLILDGEEFRSFVMTEIKHTPATDLKSVFITSLAGDDGIDAVPLISAIEEWGREQGATQTVIVGRMGWKRPLAKEGYTMDAVVFRKELI